MTLVLVLPSGLVCKQTVVHSAVVKLRTFGCKEQQQVSGSIVVSIPACHHCWPTAGDRGSIPRQRGFFWPFVGLTFFPSIFFKKKKKKSSDKTAKVDIIQDL